MGFSFHKSKDTLRKVNTSDMAFGTGAGASADSTSPFRAALDTYGGDSAFPFGQAVQAAEPSPAPSKKKHGGSSKIGRWFKSHFGSKKSEGPRPNPLKAVLPQGRIFDSVGMPTNNSDILVNISHVKPATANLNHISAEVINKFTAFDNAVSGLRIPQGNDPAFITQVGKINEAVMKAFGEFQEECISASMASTAASRAEAANPETSEMYYKQAMRLAVLAQVLHGNEIKLSKIYDDILYSYRRGSVLLFAGKSYREIYPLTDMYQFNEDTASVLGGGMINTVYSDTYQGEEHVFKPGKHHVMQVGEDGKDTTEDAVYTTLMGYEYGELISLYEGDDRKGIREAKTSNRDVAYSRLGKLFGFDVAVNTQFARGEDGKVSSLMDKAKGKTADKMKFYGGKAMRDQAFHINGDSDEGLVDITDKKMIEDVLEMSVLDLVAGHMDRNMGNYMMHRDDEGHTRVSAIDNDTSFGLNTDIEGVTHSYQTGAKHATLITSFPFITPKILSTVSSIGEGDIRSCLAGLLSEKQIDAAVERYSKLKKYFAMYQYDPSLLLSDDDTQREQQVVYAMNGIRGWNKKRFDVMMISLEDMKDKHRHYKGWVSSGNPAFTPADKIAAIDSVASLYPDVNGLEPEAKIQVFDTNRGMIPEQTFWDVVLNGQYEPYWDELIRARLGGAETWENNFFTTFGLKMQKFYSQQPGSSGAVSADSSADALFSQT